MPVKSAGMASGVIDGKIYLASGFDVDQNGEVTRLNHLSVFDPETGTWDTTGARLPVSRSMWGQMNTVLDGKFYLIGGLSFDWVIDHYQVTPYARVDVYDPQTDTWESKANLPDSLGGNGVCTDGEKLYVTGGRNRDRQFSSFYAYDPATDSWEELTEMPIIRAMHVSVALDGKIYVISGNSGMGPENRTENCIVYDPGSDQWNDIAPLPNDVVIAAACAVDGEIYVFGGQWDYGYSGDAYKYIPEEDTWITIENMLPPRSQHAAVPIGRTIYLIGGRTAVNEVIGLVQKYEPSKVCLDSFIPDDTSKCDDAIQLDLSEYFSHVNGSDISYSYCLDGSGIVEASIDGSMLTVTGVTTGNVEVSVLAESGEDQMGDVFNVNVPSVIRRDAEIPDGTINGDTIQLELSDYFSHVCGGDISYSVCPGGSGIVEASINGSILTVTGVAPGSAEVCVLAESGEDQLEDVFRVNVTSPTWIYDRCIIPSSMHIYPNPSGDLTTIYYSVQTPTTVRLEVYDLMGRRVAIPLNEYRLPGNYVDQLNTGVLDHGIYICYLSTATERVTAKLIVEH